MKKLYIYTFLIICTSLFFKCKSQKTKVEKIVTDDFSNRSYNQDYNMLINSINRKKQIEKSKILYNGKVFGFNNFLKKIGFKETDDLKIIKDSISIKKHNIKDCKILIIVNRK
jgi:hypothetical protein